MTLPHTGPAVADVAIPARSLCGSRPSAAGVGRRRVAAVVVAAFLGAMPARADDDRVPPVTDTLVRTVCGDCHMAFPPALLPARSWERMMDGLADHFGEEVIVPADQGRTIRNALVAGAGDRGPLVAGAGDRGPLVAGAGDRGSRGDTARRYLRWVAPGGAPLRITENPAFAREHSFPGTVWRDPKVVTASNCPACHRGADQGFFDD